MWLSDESHVLWTSLIILLLALPSCINAAAPIARRSPIFKNSFQQSLYIPELKKPLATYTNPETGVPIDFYEVNVKEFEKKFYPDLGKAKLLGYDGLFPGPTFRVEKGRETVVRAVNKASKTLNFHLHGSYTRSPWDGWANDVLTPGQYKDYYFPNSINGRSLWYHDHANHDNAVNIYRGLLGMYQIVDPKLDAQIGLPNQKFDVPLILTSHYFTSAGDLTDESQERASIYGDTWVVNGQIQPHLKVEPTQYRLRILNGAVSRTLNFTIEVEGKPIPFAVVAGDSGYRERPVNTKSLVTGMAERWEVVIDFAPYAGKNLLMRATNMWTDPEFANSDKIMQFQVSRDGSSVKALAKDPQLPDRLPGVDLKFPTDKIAATRNFTMVSHMDMMWGINSYHMDDSMKRVLMRPPLGTVEKYIFRSSGMSMGNGIMGSNNNNAGTGDMSGMMAGHDMGNMMGDSTGSTPTSSSGGGKSNTPGNSGMMGGHDMSNMMGGSTGSAPTSSLNSGQSSHHGSGGMMGGHDMGSMMGASTEPSPSSSGAEQMGQHGSSSMTGGDSMGNMMGSPANNAAASSSANSHSSHHGSGSMMNGMEMKRSIAGRLRYTSRNKDINKRQTGGMMQGMMGGTKFWTHAMHLHLVDMRLLSRHKEDPSKPEGRDYLESYEQGTVKDIVLIGSNEVVEVLVKFQPYPGVYMWHCHNAVHEDKGMMAIMNVTRLKDFGYNELDSKLEDPLDQRFKAQPYKGTNLQDIKSKLLPGFAKLNAYPDPIKLIALEDKYWAQKSAPGVSESGENVVPNMDPEKLAVHESHHGKSSGGNMAGMNPQASSHGSTMSMPSTAQSGQHGGSAMSGSSDEAMAGMSSGGHNSHHG